MLRFALTIFLSAFLLFQVQPIIARFILPWFGGTSAVWTVCLLFFQLVLLAGYSYAHALRMFLRPFHQAVLHLSLLVSALLLLPITPDSSLQPGLGADPFTSILLLLTVTVGIPYLLVSASGPLLQHWFKLNFPDSSPYRLYALSNVGSLLGLLTYPFLVEPLISLQAQTWFWSTGFVLLVISTASCAWPCLFQHKNGQLFDNTEVSISGATRPKHSDRVLWILLSASASVLLLATTNQVCQDIASVPFLWLLPLSLYLLSFIICFDHSRWYDRRLWLPVLLVSIPCGIYVILLGSKTSIFFQICTYNVILFAACMVCHGELVRLKPHADRLTGFYLSIAFGGALGGIFVSIIAARLFNGYWELQLIWCTILVLFGICLFREQRIMQYWKNLLLQIAWGSVCGIVALVCLGHILNWDSEIVYKNRNFYGILRIKEYAPVSGDPLRDRVLMNGSIWHGNQIINNEKTRRWPTSYYGHNSGIGVAISHHPTHNDDSGLHIGVVGMGVGTIAALAGENDTLRFYEINPLVIEVSQSYFSFLDDTAATWQAIAGDARVSMEKELANNQNQHFDVLAVDAFSGDAIPVHLLTLEAFELYKTHLKNDGILAIHISNRHLRLTPVVVSAAEHLGMQAIKIVNPDNYGAGVFESEWILLTNNKAFLDSEAMKKIAVSQKMPKADKPWTDDYSNLLSIVNF